MGPCCAVFAKGGKYSHWPSARVVVFNNRLANSEYFTICSMNWFSGSVPDAGKFHEAAPLGQELSCLC